MDTKKFTIPEYIPPALLDHSKREAVLNTTRNKLKSIYNLALVMSLFFAFLCYTSSSFTTFLIFLGILSVGLYGLWRFHKRVENTEKRRVEERYEEKSKVIFPEEELILDGVGLHWQQKGLPSERFDIAWNEIEHISFYSDPFIKYGKNQKVEFPRIMRVHYNEIMMYLVQNNKLGNAVEKRGLWGDRGERIANLRVTEDTASRLVLEMQSSHGAGYSGGGFMSRALGITLIFVFIIVWAWTKVPSSLVIDLSLIVFLILFIVIFVAWLFRKRDEVSEATVTIDLHSQRATRIEKMRSGKTRQYEIRLDQVSQVVIHSEEVGHGCDLELEAANNGPFIVRTGTFAEVESINALGHKLGDFLKKPVTQKWTDQGNPLGEETSQ